MMKMMMLMFLLLLANALCDGFISIPYTKPMSIENTHIHSHKSNTFDKQSNDTINDISISVQRILPNITQHEARDAWIEYHWIKGGGLPIAILNKDDIIQTTEQSTYINNENRILERTILPIFMKERLEYNDESTTLQYRVTEAGPFFADLVDGSHSASVTFDSTEKDDSIMDGCIMTWNVTFATTRLASVYEKVTQFTVGTAATTVQEATATPRLFSMTINGSLSNQQSINPVYARGQCLDFVFAKGGGLPLPPPIPFGSVLPEGNGLARQKLLRIPPIIVESIIDMDTASDNEMAEFSYQLNNPGWLTFPFLLHTHLGRIRFTSVPSSTSDASSSSDLVINWQVEIRPYKFASTVMEKLVEMTVSTILRNLRIHLIEPDAQVIIKPPRGGNTDTITSFGTINKDTWLGGVLDVHLSDTRSTFDQTISLFQPWKWGRSGDGDEDDNVQYMWTDGRIN